MKRIVLIAAMLAACGFSFTVFANERSEKREIKTITCTIVSIDTAKSEISVQDSTGEDITLKFNERHETEMIGLLVDDVVDVTYKKGERKNIVESITVIKTPPETATGKPDPTPKPPANPPTIK